jgi:hypothetical protein
MRITIDIEDPSGDPPNVASGTEARRDSSTASAPADVLATALAVGATSAGQAPSGPPLDGPPAFIPDTSSPPGTDPTGGVVPGSDNAQSAGAAAL